jgi:cytoskeletal protein CcmA (bactofilin family)
VEAAEKIEIRKDAKLTGDIRTARIIIEDGAYFKGSIDIVKPEPAAKPAVSPVTKRSAASTKAKAVGSARASKPATKPKAKSKTRPRAAAAGRARRP